MSLKRHVTNTNEIIKIAKLLSEVMIKTEAGEDTRARCEYQPGWDDIRVAKEIGGQVAANHVSRIRREQYGNFLYSNKKIGGHGGYREIKAQLTKIQDEMRAISLSNAHALLRINEIERALGMAPTTVSGKAKPQPDMSEPKKEIKSVAHA